MNIKDQILNATDSRLEPVEVPEWGCTVHVPVMTIEDMQQFQNGEGANDVARMATFVIRDEHGQRIFSDDEAPLLAKRSVAAVNRVIQTFNRINGFDEDPSKNLPATPTSVSA